MFTEEGTEVSERSGSTPAEGLNIPVDTDNEGLDSIDRATASSNLDVDSDTDDDADDDSDDDDDEADDDEDDDSDDIESTENKSVE
jgi:hypothetical protein